MNRPPSSASRADRRTPVAVLALALAVGCGGEERAPADEGSPVDSAAIGTPPALVGDEAPDGSPFSYVYRCTESFAVAARPRGDGVSLVLPGRDVVLPRGVAASGVRYEADGVVFWERGGEARVELSDTAFTGCVRSAATDPWHEAALRGVTARALGQEPGWIAEVDPDRFLHLELDYGQRRILLPAPSRRSAPGDTAGATGADAGTVVFRSRTDTHDATLRFIPEPCADPMSGQRSSHTVRLEVDGEVYEGCGRLLATEAGPS